MWEPYLETSYFGAVNRYVGSRVPFGIFYPTSVLGGGRVWVDKSLIGIQKLPAFEVTVGIRFICFKLLTFVRKFGRKEKSAQGLGGS